MLGQSDIDALTGCRTRATLPERLGAMLAEARRTGARCSILLFDVDYFKSVNDAYGHARGDEILQAAVARVDGMVRERDELYRYGGDEFVLLLPGAGRDRGFDVARRIVDRIGRTPFPGDPPLSVSVSLGVATFPDDAVDAAGLMAAADRRNYIAKRRGRAQAVADDMAWGDNPDVSSRLLERDTALSVVQDFLVRLVEEKRGTLAVYGPSGSGHSRFLAEVAKIGKLRGFTVRTGSHVADLVTSAADPGSTHGVDAVPPADGPDTLIVLDTDDAATVDAALAVARRTSRSRVVGLVYAAAGAGSPAREGVGSRATTVELTPWSTAALRTWLRTTLRGEPEPDLIDWLDAHSGGLPALATRELNRLVKRSALERSRNGGWTLTPAVRSEAERRRGSVDDARHAASRMCQLPPPVPDFTGRDGELTELVELARKASAGEFTGAPVASIYGQAGVGKTTLAVHLAHVLAEYFPDGQWYIDLSGMDDRPLEPADALGRLLTALGVPSERIPAEVAQRSALYRALTNNRRLLIVLDNAASEAQVRPLLPANPLLLVLVTSRRSLAGLEGVRRLSLDMLSADVAVSLLTQIIGVDRVAAEPAAAFEVARLCGFLPLALRIAGNRLASRPGWTIGYLAEHLRNDQHRLEVLTAGDLQIRSTFAVSYGHLTPRAQAAFRRLSLVPGPEFDAALAAVLIEVDPFEAGTVLDELADASLIEAAPAPGRYRFHDLVRIFARERLDSDKDSEDGEDRASEQRLLAWLLDAATRAALLIGTNDDDCPQPGPAAAGAARFADDAAALRWLDAEWGNWLGALRRGSRFGMHADVIRLAWAMHWYSDIRTHRNEWREIFTLGLEAARALGDRNAECVLLDYVAWACTVSGRVGEARPLLQETLGLAREVGNRKEEGWALVYLGNCEMHTGRPEASMDWYRQAIDVFSAIEFHTGLCAAYSHLGEAMRRSGRPMDCMRYQEQAMEASTRVGSAIAPGVILLRMGQALATLGRPHDAARRYTEAVDSFRQAGNLVHEGRALYTLAQIQIDLGKDDAAVTSLEAAVRIFREIRDLSQQAVALRTLGEMMKNRRDDGSALAYQREAAAILAKVEASRLVPSASSAGHDRHDGEGRN